MLTTDGQVITGVIAGETSTAVTLRGADNKTTTVLRVDIDEMHNTGKSLMPEGFEKLIDKQSMADLLTFCSKRRRQRRNAQMNERYSCDRTTRSSLDDACR